MASAAVYDQPGFDAVEFVLCDLDGVVWLARTAIPGAPEAISRLRAAGRRVLFVTNNSVSLVADQERALADIGVPASGDVVTSAQAAATLVAPGEHVLVCGGPGIGEAVTAAGGVVVPFGRGAAPDVVVVGLDREFDFGRLTEVSAAVREGARFVATNDDATFPTPGGSTPGAGSIVAAVATASGRAPTVAGKPHGPMADVVSRRCGAVLTASNAVMVGDRWSTDGAFAEAIGCRFALVRTGVTPVGVDAGGAVDLDESDLGGVAARLLG